MTDAEGRSRFTGLTRSDWEATADRLLEAVVPHAVHDGAGYDLPGPRVGANGRDVDALEGFARTFLLAAFRIPQADPARRDQLVRRYAAGLVAATRTTPDRGGAAAGWRWPSIDDTAQAMVEAGSIALGLLLTKEWLWDALSRREQNDIAGYLARLRGHPLVNGNWQFFRIMVECFLREAGHGFDERTVDESLDRIAGDYRGGGLYTDGGGAAARKFDYYTAWAYHFYAPLWARFDGDARRPDLVRVFRDRLGDYLPTGFRLIGADGAPVLLGRSATYRAAVVAPFWGAALMEVPEVSPGALRRAASGVLRWVLDAPGSLVDGMLTLGWRHEHLPVTQTYSGPASPYWMSKAFSGLLLPADHPVWTAPEEPLPIELGDVLHRVPAAGWVVHGTRADGIVRVTNHGTSRPVEERDPHSRHLRDDPFYNRLAYSSASAPTIEALGGITEAADNQATVQLPTGLAVRAEIAERVAPDAVIASHSVLVVRAAGAEHSRDDVPIAEVDSSSSFAGGDEIRVHRFRALAGSTLQVSGWALGSDDSIETTVDAASAAVVATDGRLTSSLRLLPPEPGETGVRLESLTAEALGAGVRGSATVVPLARHTVLGEAGQIIDVTIRVAVGLSGPTLL